MAAPEEDGNSVKVVCRFRPYNSREKEKDAEMESAMNIDRGDYPIAIEDEIQCNIYNVPEPGREDQVHKEEYNFDSVLDKGTTQMKAFKNIGLPMVMQMLDHGYNSTIFVYGQTGAGKTYTMLGPEDEVEMSQGDSMGVYPRSVITIFEVLKSKREMAEAKPNTRFESTVEVAFLEIYNDRFYDLLEPTSKKKLKMGMDKARNNVVRNLSRVEVESPEEAFEKLNIAGSHRRKAATKQNATSSRSHMIMTVYCKHCETSGDPREEYVSQVKVKGMINFCDLAGSEKAKKTGAAGKQMKEAQAINKSLSALVNVIKRIGENSTAVNKEKIFVPFRDSKLTEVLQDSLAGDCKTLLIINASKALYNRTETISTLKFGRNCKAIKTKAKSHKKKSLLKQYIERVEELEQELAEYKAGGGTKPVGLTNVEQAEDGTAEPKVSVTNEENVMPPGNLTFVSSQGMTYEQMKFQIMEYESTIDALTQSNNEYKAAVDEAAIKLDKMGEDRAKMKDRENALDTMKAELKEQMDSLERELSQAQQTLQDKDSLLDLRQQTIGLLNNQLEQSQERMSEIQSQASNESTAEAFAKHTEETKEMLAKLEDDLMIKSSNAGKISVLEDEKNTLFEKNSKLSEEIGAYKYQINDLKNKLNGVREENESLEAMFNDHKWSNAQETEELKQQIDALEEQKEELLAEFEQLKNSEKQQGGGANITTSAPAKRSAVKFNSEAQTQEYTLTEDEVEQKRSPPAMRMIRTSSTINLEDPGFQNAMERFKNEIAAEIEEQYPQAMEEDDAFGSSPSRLQFQDVESVASVGTGSPTGGMGTSFGARIGPSSIIDSNDFTSYDEDDLLRQNTMTNFRRPSLAIARATTKALLEKIKEAELDDKNEQIVDLQVRLNDCKKQVEDLTAERDGLLEQLEQQIALVEELQHNFESAQSEVELLTEQNSQLQEKLANVQTEMMPEVANITTSIVQEANEWTEWFSENTSAEEYTDEMREFTNSNPLVADIIQILATKLEDQVQHTAMIESKKLFEQEQKEKERKKNAELQEQLKDASIDLSKVEDVGTFLVSKFKIIKLTNKGLTAERRLLRGEKQLHDSQVKRLKKELVGKDKKISELQAKLRRVREQRSS